MLGIHSIINGSLVALSIEPWVGKISDNCVSLNFERMRFTGFPLDFFPVLFAVPRVVGWLAHWRQVSLCSNIRCQLAHGRRQMMLQDGGVKIWRPRQVWL